MKNIMKLVWLSWILKITAIGALLIALYMVIDFGSSKDIMSIYSNLRPDTVNGFNKKLEFIETYTRLTGDYTLALDKGYTEDDVDEIIEGGTLQDDYGPISDHSHISYRQYNLTGRIHSNCSISGGGCGWCSLTSMCAELNPGVCGSITPEDWLNIMPTSVKNYWSAGNMNWGAVPSWVNQLNSMGTYGQYKIIRSGGSGTPSLDNTLGAMEDIANYAKDPNCVVIISSSSGLFTNNGHIICVTDLDDSGQYFHVDDSSGVASSHLGIDWSVSNTYGFPLYNSDGSLATQHKGYQYNFKGWWVIRRES